MKKWKKYALICVVFINYSKFGVKELKIIEKYWEINEKMEKFTYYPLFFICMASFGWKNYKLMKIIENW